MSLNKETLIKVRDILFSRAVIKAGFFILFAYSVIRLLGFERWARGEGEFVSRPEAVAGLLPVGHFTSFFGWVRGFGWDTLLPAGLIIILAALLVSLFFKRGFCGYVCPVGTVWEGSSWLGRTLLGKNIRLPRWLDLLGRGFQIVVTVAAMGFLFLVPLAEVATFRELPYMWVADLKIIHSFAQPGFLIAIVIAIGISFFFTPLWCRYLCPVGGLYSIVGMASPCKVHRDEETCIQCGKCAKACPVLIDPALTKSVNTNTCDGCMECVKVCPVDECLQAKVVNRFVIAPWMWGLGVVVLWVLIYVVALSMGQWHSTIPVDTFKSVINSGLLDETTKGFF